MHAAISAHQPLAERLRPSSLGKVIGQQHVLGAGMPLWLAFESGRPRSRILSGPPGLGKTTVGRLMADAFDAQVIRISAVLGGVKDIREAVERDDPARDGLMQEHAIVFVGEVRRFNEVVDPYIKQRIRKVVVQLLGLTHCSVGAAHA